MFAGRECILKLIRDALPRSHIAARITHGHCDQEVEVSFVFCGRADLQRILENVEWDVVAVGGVIVPIGARRISGLEDDL